MTKGKWDCGGIRTTEAKRTKGTPRIEIYVVHGTILKRPKWAGWLVNNGGATRAFFPTTKE